jgi:hypothetical protein
MRKVVIKMQLHTFTAVFTSKPNTFSCCEGMATVNMKIFAYRSIGHFLFFLGYSVLYKPDIEAHNR